MSHGHTPGKASTPSHPRKPPAQSPPSSLLPSAPASLSGHPLGLGHESCPQPHPPAHPLLSQQVGEELQAGVCPAASWKYLLTGPGVGWAREGEWAAPGCSRLRPAR